MVFDSPAGLAVCPSDGLPVCMWACTANCPYACLPVGLIGQMTALPARQLARMTCRLPAAVHEWRRGLLQVRAYLHSGISDGRPACLRS